MTRSGRHEMDMLHGSMWNKIPLFALPVAATAILEQLFNASDLAIVGNFAMTARTQAVAAVGANTWTINLIVNLFIGVALGANVVIATAIGQRNPERVKKAVMTSITVALWGGVVVAVLGQFATDPIMRAMHVPDDSFELASTYLRIYLAGMPAILLYNFEAAIFRSVGETTLPLVALAGAGALNVGLNLLFVVVIGMTVDGVALATVISNIASALILYRQLRKTSLDIHVDAGMPRVDRVVMRSIARIGLPAGIQSCVFSVANIVLQSAINSLGTIVMAGSSAGFMLEVISYSILNSFSQACTTFTGQNYGAQQMGRCRRSLYISLGECLVAMLAMASVFLPFGRQILSIFNQDPRVIEAGYTRVAYIIPGHLMSMWYDIMSGYLRGFGISLVPAILTIIGVCGIRLTWVNTVFVADPTFQTIMLVYPISLGITTIMVLVALLWYHPSRRYAKAAHASGRRG